jgi:hypothetical protein
MIACFSAQASLYDYCNSSCDVRDAGEKVHMNSMRPVMQIDFQDVNVIAAAAQGGKSLPPSRKLLDCLYTPCAHLQRWFWVVYTLSPAMPAIAIVLEQHGSKCRALEQLRWRVWCLP